MNPPRSDMTFQSAPTPPKKGPFRMTFPSCLPSSNGLEKHYSKSFAQLYEPRCA